ncbi:MAG: hypothetical protein AABZ60_10170 [Planctomycetota bacterium]
MKSSFSAEEFVEIVSKRILSLQTISFGLVMSVVLFFALILALTFLQSPQIPSPQKQASQLSELKLFSMVNAILLSSSFMMAFLLPHFSSQKRLLSLRQYQDKEPLYESALQIFRASLILKLALLEGSALFGLVVCFLGSQAGTLQKTPVFWLNAFPSLVFILIWIFAFPNKARLQHWFEFQVRPVLEESIV